MLFLVITTLPLLLFIWYYLYYSKLNEKLQQRIARYQVQANVAPSENATISLLKEIVMKSIFRLGSLPPIQFLRPPKLRKQVRYAGWFSKKAAAIFLGNMTLINIAIILLIILIIVFSETWRLRLTGTPFRILFTGILVTFFCIQLPKIVLKHRIKNYNDMLFRELPNFFELYILNISSGFSSVQAWENMLYIMRDVYPKTSKQIDLLISELHTLPSHDAAWLSFIRRLKDESLRDAVRIMHQCEVNGLPLERDLSIQIEQINKRYLAKIERKIAKLPTLILFPVLVFIFPSLFIVLLGPGIIKMLSFISS